MTTRRGELLFDAGVVKLQLPHEGRRKVLHEHVGVLQQPEKHLASRRGADVQGYAQLTGVEEEKKAAGFVTRLIAGEGAVASGGVAAKGLLHLDYLGPKVGQEPCAEGGRDVVPQLNDPDSLESLHRRPLTHPYRFIVTLSDSEGPKILSLGVVLIERHFRFFVASLLRMTRGGGLY